MHITQTKFDRNDYYGLKKYCLNSYPNRCFDYLNNNISPIVMKRYVNSCVIIAILLGNNLYYDAETKLK